MLQACVTGKINRILRDLLLEVTCNYSNFKFIQFRSVLHNAVRDVTFEMFKAHGFHAKVEPLFSKLGLDLINNSRRGDLHGPFVDSSQIILDVITVDPCAQTYVNGLNSKGFNHLETAENRKIDLYSKDAAKLNQNVYIFKICICSICYFYFR
ncbi:hypothetical protein GEMRC1_011072 [Eukaryota sp. GEM-RC1]